MESAEPLTLKVLEDAFRAIENAPPDPCSIGRHVVSAAAINEKRAWAMCGNCGRLVRLR